MQNKHVVVMLAAAALIVSVAWYLTNNSTKMTAPQKVALQELLQSDQKIAEGAIHSIKLTNELKENFPAVKKAFVVSCGGQNYYAFWSRSLGYRSAIDLFIVIGGEKNAVMGIRVLQHGETPLYGGDSLTKAWFLNRFSNKSVDTYLNRVALDPAHPNDIIQITCATVSSQAVINGVNAAIGVYRELVLGQEAQPVPLKVEGFVTEIK